MLLGITTVALMGEVKEGDTQLDHNDGGFSARRKLEAKINLLASLCCPLLSWGNKVTLKIPSFLSV